jgi:dolichol-phosphate mannosyltransferase
MKAPEKLSVIIPVYFEGKLVHKAYEMVSAEVSKQFEDYEVLFIDDGSGDNTFEELQLLANEHKNVKVVKFATNAGSHMAIRAGMDYASGDLVSFIACDMQEPPELIYKMYQVLEKPYEIVWAVRNSRKDSWGSVIFSNTFYFFARRIVSKNIPPKGSSMFLMTRKVVDSIRRYHERNLTLEGLMATMGYKSTHILYERQERMEGKSKWTLAKKIKLFVDFFVAYSYFPIRFISVTGILFSIIGFAWTIYIILRHFLVGDLSSGWPALISVLLVGFGITNISLGIIAEYLWRTLDEARKRPNYIVEYELNIDSKK